MVIEAIMVYSGKKISQAGTEDKESLIYSSEDEPRTELAQWPLHEEEASHQEETVKDK